MDYKKANEKLTKWLSDNIIIVYLLFIFSILILPILFTRCSLIGFGSDANEIGDAINGLTAPIIGAFSVLLVYLAFKSQLDANEKLNIANEELLKFSKRQLYATEFTMFKEKLEYIKEHYNVNFLFVFLNTTSNWEKANTTAEIATLKYKVNKYLDLFKDNKRTEMIRAIKILSIYNKQLSKSSLSEDDKDVLGIECKRLNYIKKNIDLYKIDREVKTQILTGEKNRQLLKKYDTVIMYIEKLT